jgi:hypothetical protein
MSQWEVATQAVHSQTSSAAQQPHEAEYRLPQESESGFANLPPPPTYPPALANADLPRLEEPQYNSDDPSLNGYGIAAIGLGAGMGFGFLPNPLNGHHQGADTGSVEHSFGASFPYMFPSWYETFRLPSLCRLTY